MSTVFDWLLSHALQCAIGTSAFLALGVAGFRCHSAPAARHAWAETVLACTLACLVLLALPLPRPLRVKGLDALVAPSDSAVGAPPSPSMEGAASGSASSSWTSWSFLDSVETLGWMEIFTATIAFGAAALIGLLVLAAVNLGQQIRRAQSLDHVGQRPGRLVAASARVARPFCVGTRRFGAILVPLSITSESRAVDLAAILAHEHAHLDAGHGRARLLAAIAAPFLYWNPLYWFLVRRMRRDAELCADDAAARSVGRAPYVRSLLAIVDEMPARRPLPSPNLGVSSSTSDLLTRMENLMSRSNPLDASPSLRRRKTSIGLALAATLLINAACGTTGGITPRSPVEYEAITFEVLDLEGTTLGTELERDAQSSAPFPDRVKEVDHRPVALDGYMIPLVFDENDKVIEFMLVRDLTACCMGGVPMWWHWIHCKVSEGSAVDYAPFVPIRVKGHLMLNDPSKWSANEFSEGVYEMRDWRVGGSGTGQP